MSALTAPARWPKGSDVDKADLGENIRRLRKRAGLSQVALAEALGIPQSAVSQWETGVHVPPMTTTPELAAALGCDVAELFAESKPARKRK